MTSHSNWFIDLLIKLWQWSIRESFIIIILHFLKHFSDQINNISSIAWLKYTYKIKISQQSLNHMLFQSTTFINPFIGGKWERMSHDRGFFEHLIFLSMFCNHRFFGANIPTCKYNYSNYLHIFFCSFYPWKNSHHWIPNICHWSHKVSCGVDKYISYI